MREIKFRLVSNKKIVGYEKSVQVSGVQMWQKKSDGERWHFKYIHHDHKEQYIGTKDVKKKEIYEGDIVVMTCNNGGDGINEPYEEWEFKGQVIYCAEVSAFGLQTKLCEKGQIETNFRQESSFDESEIIGNIHENPELLEAK